MNPTNNHAESSAHPTGHSAQAELNQLLQEIGTANPQELLVRARTSLTAALLQATALTLVVMVCFTFGPRLWSSPSATPAAKPAPVPQDTATAPPTQPAPKENPKIAADTTKPPPVSKAALEKLGVNEVKKADPKVNPLDNGTDDLLKDIDKK